MFLKLLEELHTKGIELTFNEGKLQFSGPKEYITDELLARIRQNKGKLIKHYWPLKNSNLMPISADGSKTPLVMVHGELANYFLSETLGEDRPFYGFLHIGSEGERIKHHRVSDFVKDYIKNLKKVLPNGPFLLGGYSFGGIVAYEMACTLLMEGKDVPFLTLIDCIPPNFKTFNYLAETPVTKGFGFRNIFNFFNNYYLKVYFKTRRFIWSLLTTLHIKLKPELRKKIIVDNYNQILRKYTPTKFFNGKIILYIAKENPRSINDYKQWLRFCKDLEIITLDGNHDTILKNQQSILKLQQTFRERIDSTNV